MKTLTLTDYQAERLLEALRRDMRSEAYRGLAADEWADLHRMNARHDVDLLQTINPKSPQLPTPLCDVPLELPAPGGRP